MAFKHIVVAFDGSASADKALSYAKDMARETVGCTLRIVSVTSNPDAVIPLDISSNDFAPNAHLNAGWKSRYWDPLRKFLA